ncbi:MAG TPA: efflux RND transporter permease subunit [Steroidobacteraceae bacterium]|nr:efflux RND transporter permease subunit [Steroidobacteraceae bacterium]
MNQFNASAWALEHKSFVGFLMVLLAVAGLLSFDHLGRDEDPPFTIKVMVVRAVWPGATAEDTAREVTDRLEKALQSLQWIDYISSYTKPGEATLMVNLKDQTPPSAVPDQWYQVRKKIADIRQTLPQGTQGPFFNDEFGDVYAVIYGFTTDGFTYRDLRDRVESVRSELLRVPNVGKVDLIGVQNEVVYVDFSTRELAGRGINTDQLAESLRAQNAVSASGILETSRDRVAVRVSGQLKTIENIEQLSISVHGRLVPLRDLAKVTRNYEDPPTSLFRYNGEPAIGLAVGMVKGGNILEVGKDIEATMHRVERDFPVGIDPHRVANQPEVVQESVGHFTRALTEAVVIVLLVSFASLGLRAGVVVAVCIPLVLAITFVAMRIEGISLQRISLGALVIALGLLVDDAMIAVEMMIRKLEEGFDRFRAATFAYTSTAFPMLTGTLVTVAGFLPVGFAKSGAGEYCFTLFAVVAIALLVSWLVAIVFIPYLGDLLLKERPAQEAPHQESRMTALFRKQLVWALRRRRWVVAGTAALFFVSLAAFTLVEQQFFPAADRAELLVSLTLPHNGSIAGTQDEVARLEKVLLDDPGIESHSFYVGAGAVRFYLPLDVQLENANYAQAVVVTKSYDVRDSVRDRLQKVLDEQFPAVLSRVEPLQLGPPVDWPIQYRVGGSAIGMVRALADQVSTALRSNANTRTINFNWYDMGRSVLVTVDQEKARLVGMTSEQVAKSLNDVLSGRTVTQLRDDIYLVDVRGRAVDLDRKDLGALRDLQIRLPNGNSVPLAQIASFSYGLEEPVVWRRDRLPTITVQADIVPGIQAATVNQQLADAMDKIRASMPPGYRLEDGGAVEQSAKGQRSVLAVIPVMFILMLLILMVQLQSAQKLAIVMLTAPLGLIGVTLALLLSHKPFGFVSMLGVFALTGMVIRNSVVLIAQIQANENEKMDRWHAIVDAVVHRLRPILLTAAAAILGLIPIAGEVFWGPMAYAMMGGLLVATVLTLFFLPALYAMWYRVRDDAAHTS